MLSGVTRYDSYTYVAYEGDKLVCIGTRQEIADFWGISPETVTFYATPAYRKRWKDDGRIVVRVREEQ